jgi:tRNA-2-methylthio-N6-dimethylallyladenosine synthase
MKTYSIKTFGCQMNISDSERVAAVCKSMGYSECPEGQEAQLYVINTCSVRQKAEDRVMGLGRQFFKSKQKNPNTKVLLTGCMAKRDIRQGFEKSQIYQEKYAGTLIKKMPWLDYVLEINDIHKLPEVLNEQVETQVTDYLSVKPKYDSKFQAYVPISTGCNKFCTFCIVPFTRGKEVYRPFNEIYTEVKNLVEQGYKEITLLGQNVNSWKSEVHGDMAIPIPKFRKTNKTDETMDFADLMEVLGDIPGEFWLRFTSSHPYDINPRLIEVVRDKENIAKQFHFALQSGSNTVLKRMNRHYTRDEFKEKVELIKSIVPEVAITTDVIVGFSGETEVEFEDTVSLCNELRFDQIFISEYSRREGTIAAKFYKDDISNEVKADRKIRLDIVLKVGVVHNNESLVGTTQKVLIYRNKIKNRAGVFGRSTHGKDVLIQDIDESSVKIGEFINVRITGFKGFCLEGEGI